jgi:hypothetical protein
MEEVASFWNVTLGWQIFFACMTSVFARAFAESLYEGENPGLFSNTITYEVTRKVNTHVLAMGVAVFIGAACGLTAALFTRVNLKWCAAANALRRAGRSDPPRAHAGRSGAHATWAPSSGSASRSPWCTCSSSPPSP